MSNTEVIEKTASNRLLTWEKTSEPSRIDWIKTESGTGADGFPCRWRYGIYGGFVYCKFEYHMDGWKVDIHRKPIQ